MRDEKIRSCTVISLTYAPLILPFAVNVVSISHPCVEDLEFHFPHLSSVTASFMASYDLRYPLPHAPHVYTCAHEIALTLVSLP